jgi:uncharacterized RDD family membrane protein YckC
MDRTLVQQPVVADPAVRAAALLLDLCLIGLLARLVFLLPWIGPANPVTGLVTAFSVAWLYFAMLPLTPLQSTLGKWVCKIRLCDCRGRRLGWANSTLRASAVLAWGALPLIGFTLSDTRRDELFYVAMLCWALFVLPGALIESMPRHESLFDLIGGSLVVWRKADAAAVAEAQPVQELGYFRIGCALFAYLSIACLLAALTNAPRDRDRPVRIAYAMREILPLRDRIAAFYIREKRWPTAAEVGIAEWTPYPAGGGYRLQPEGTIVIRFSVLPGLKGHSLSFQPKLDPGGKQVQWRCSADPAFKATYVPSACRE